jgi:hypothetical protein
MDTHKIYSPGCAPAGAEAIWWVFTVRFPWVSTVLTVWFPWVSTVLTVLHSSGLNQESGQGIVDTHGVHPEPENGYFWNMGLESGGPGGMFILHFDEDS